MSRADRNRSVDRKSLTVSDSVMTGCGVPRDVDDNPTTSSRPPTAFGVDCCLFRKAKWREIECRAIICIDRGCHAVVSKCLAQSYTEVGLEALTSSLRRPTPRCRPRLLPSIQRPSKRPHDTRAIEGEEKRKPLDDGGSPYPYRGRDPCSQMSGPVQT
jgi:hypothetical protein